jgi:DNA-binding NarL/FixJ family response regulator
MAEQRIVILDPQPAYRMGLRSILEHESSFRVVAEFGDNGIPEGAISDHAPDLVMVDYDATRYQPHQLVSWIRSEYPSTRILVNAASFAVGTLFSLLRTGINGYVTKNVTADTVREAVRMVLGGELFICARDSLGSLGSLPEGFGRSQSETAGTGNTLEELTARERQIFELIARGYTTHTIGTALGISHRTVENHRSNIMRKLSLHSQIDLVLYAARIGLVDL